MRKLKITLAALTLLLAGSVTSFAQTADEIINKHIAAIGGAEAWKKVNSLRLEGSINMQGMEIGITETHWHNKGLREDIEVNGMKGYSIITPKEGWNFMPFAGQASAEAMTADEVKQSQDRLDIQGDFIDYKAKGSKIELVGKDEVEGTEVYKFSITDKDGNQKTAYIDTKDFFLIRQVQKMKADGKEMEMTFDFSNFQKQAGGVIFPMVVSTPQGEVKFSKVEVNNSVDESLFKPAN